MQNKHHHGKSFQRASASSIAQAARTHMEEDPFLILDATAQGELVSSGAVSARELVEAAIKRIEILEPSVNALTSECFDQALAAADGLLPDGPFQGVPYLIKDLNAYKGQSHTYGSVFFSNQIAEDNSKYIEKTLETGVVVVGKSATPEFALLATTESVLNGPTRNPWSLDRSPSGSSGGAAAAVASGMVPFAHANDGGGSIRNPASACNLFGFKPSRDRTERTFSPVGPIDIESEHCVSHSVRDSAQLLSHTEAQSSNMPFDRIGLVTPTNLKTLRIGYAPATANGKGPEPEVDEVLKQTIELCEELGHSVELVELPINLKEVERSFLEYWGFGALTIVEKCIAAAGLEASQTGLEPWTQGLAKWFLSEASENFIETLGKLKMIEPQMQQFFNNWDLLLTPTLRRAPILIGEQAPTVDFDELIETVPDYAAYTATQNIAGMPAMSVPLGLSSDGLPVGSHFSASKGNDRLLLEFAYALEEAQPWKENLVKNSFMLGNI